jgi:hypothetical protein
MFEDNKLNNARHEIFHIAKNFWGFFDLRNTLSPQVLKINKIIFLLIFESKSKIK